MAAHQIKPENLLPDGNFICFVIPALFSQAECEQLLSSEMKDSFQKAITNYPTYYRNNERFVKDDADLASYLFEKAKPYLPERIETTSAIHTENGIWNVKEVNSRIRFCKYSKDQYFHRHLDGIHYRDERTQSKLTFMIYLNSASEFQGGRTLFFKTKLSEEIWASYLPRQGDLIVFDHQVWHEGEVLTDGEKFVLRSDILYTKDQITISKEFFSGHLGYIWSLIKFNDNTILSGGRDKEIKSWSSAGHLQRSLKGHQNSILCLEKINENLFVSGSRDRKIILWKNYCIDKIFQVHDALVLSLCRLDDHTFASASGDNRINIINIDGTVLKILEEHNNWVWQVIRLDEQIIASCSEDHTIKIWNINHNLSIQTFLSDSPVMCIAHDPYTKQLISGSLNGEIVIRTLTADYKIDHSKTFTAHQGIIRTIKFLNKDRFATGGEDNKVKIWNMNGELLSELEHQNFVQSIEVLHSNTLLSASYDGTIKKWELN